MRKEVEMNLFKGIDLQVNGWGGVDFSDRSLTIERVENVTEALANRGTVGYCATVITTGLEVYKHVLPLLARAMEAPGSKGRLHGIHLEGPFVSREDGVVGAHPAGDVQDPSIDRFKQLQDLAGGHIRLVTLAPERRGALELIEYLVENKVIVSIGHTLADSGQIRDACRAGATLASHVGNGIPNELNRTNNAIWSILASPLSIMLITDGFHLPMNFLRVAYSTKGAEKIIITSDAAPVAGKPPGKYVIFGTQVRLMRGGCVRNLNAPTLAGSGSSLARCAEVCKGILDLSDSELKQMCYSNAATVLKM